MANDMCTCRLSDEELKKAAWRIVNSLDPVEELRQVRDQTEQRKDEELLIARRLLHAVHCPGGYADDGELQSNWTDCMIDFKRDPMVEIEAKIFAHGAAKYAEQKGIEQRVRAEYVGWVSHVTMASQIDAACAAMRRETLEWASNQALAHSGPRCGWSTRDLSDTQRRTAEAIAEELRRAAGSEPQEAKR